ncbi:hypothetical protein ACWC5I_20030 [Kitasatospora sp. NPDC001574]
MTTTDRTEPTTEQDGPGGDGPQAHPFGPELGPLVDEVRRFAAAVGGKAQEASAETLISLAGMADRLRETPRASDGPCLPPETGPVIRMSG